MIHLVKQKATPAEIADMLATLGTYIKLAVDVRRAVLAGGGEMHADCEEVLLDHGSEQADIWGADWTPESQEVEYESLINIRPRQGNRSMMIQDASIRSRVEVIVRDLLSQK